MEDFSTAGDTFVVSDLHLADAEPPHPRIPLWKKFKSPEFFLDDKFAGFLKYIQTQARSPIELVLNGDIFDFDSVMAAPRDAGGRPLFPMSWLERKRGLKPEEAKSRYKIKKIFEDHHRWVTALAAFLKNGHRAIFVIGNHDIELHWPSVQDDIVKRLTLPGAESQVRFVEWFYISNQDTLIEHGNQYDAYSLCSNPINPLIRGHHGAHIRIPFGNLAGKFMLNGMGLMNPHIESSYIKSSLAEYLAFFVKYIVRTQPFLMWTWFWSAITTLVVSVSEGFRPAMTDPLTVSDRIEKIAEKANASPKLVLALRELHAHPAYYNPLQILRELWLDRAIAIGLAIFVSFQFFSFLNVFIPVSIWWFIVPLVLLMPIPIFYARTVNSDVESAQAAAIAAAPTSARLANLFVGSGGSAGAASSSHKIARVVHGHTHREMQKMLTPASAAAPALSPTPAKDSQSLPTAIEYLNTGTWSPAFRDVECTQPYGKKCFAWIRPERQGSPIRIASLHDWEEGNVQRIPPIV